MKKLLILPILAAILVAPNPASADPLGMCGGVHMLDLPDGINCIAEEVYQ